MLGNHQIIKRQPDGKYGIWDSISEGFVAKNLDHKTVVKILYQEVTRNGKLFHESIDYMTGWLERNPE